MQRWRAPVATGPVDAQVAVPGSKSLTNRALVLAALSELAARIGNPLRARDTELMAAALRALGARIAADPAADAGWLITPGQAVRGPAEIDCGLAGTVMRFVPPIATLTATADEPINFDGDPRLVGQFVDLQITEAMPNSLRGRLAGCATVGEVAA